MTRYRKRYEVLEVERLAEGVTRLAKAVSALIAVSALYALAWVADGWVEAAWGCAVGLLLAASAVQTVRWWLSVRRARAARMQLKSPPARRKAAGSVAPSVAAASSVAASSRLHVSPPPAAAAATAAASSSDENLAALQAAQLRASGQFTKGRALMQAAAKANPRSEKAHVLLCELCNDEASSFRSKTAEQEEALRAGSAAAEALMLGFPASASGWKWSAVFLARLTSYKPLTEKLADGLVVKTHALKALSLDKNDALVNHVMGAWKLNVANLTWIQRTAASALSGGSALEGTIEEALNYAEACRDNGGDFMENSVLLGDCYRSMGKAAEADRWYTTALQQNKGPKNIEAQKAKIVEKMQTPPAD